MLGFDAATDLQKTMQYLRSEFLSCHIAKFGIFMCFSFFI